MLTNQNCTLKPDSIYWVIYPNFSGKYHLGEKAQNLLNSGKAISACPVSTRDIKDFEIKPE